MWTIEISGLDNHEDAQHRRILIPPKKSIRYPNKSYLEILHPTNKHFCIAEKGSVSAEAAEAEGSVLAKILLRISWSGCN